MTLNTFKHRLNTTNIIWTTVATSILTTKLGTPETWTPSFSNHRTKLAHLGFNSLFHKWFIFQCSHNLYFQYLVIAQSKNDKYNSIRNPNIQCFYFMVSGWNNDKTCAWSTTIHSVFECQIIWWKSSQNLWNQQNFIKEKN